MFSQVYTVLIRCVAGPAGVYSGNIWLDKSEHESCELTELSLVNIVAIVLLASIVWYFFDAMRAREIATAIVRTYCKQSQLQFLDGTVGLRTIGVSVSSGRIQLKRRYEFHYSEAGHSRSTGLVILTGDHVESFILQNSTPDREDSSLRA